VGGDDIVFGEMKVRDPERLPRPDRDRRYACVAYEVPAPIDLPIFLNRRTADAIERHALSDTSVELGGILLGKECIDPATGQAFVWITQALEAKHYANTQASFTYTHDSWEEITRERDRLHSDCDIVGWYHTHPSFGIFLSHHDLFIHQHFFAQPLQVAYVVDPINQTRGFFQWRDGGLAQVGGYYLTADRGDRVALARLANDLEKLPNPEGGGGGALSPRLEAELIKMLTRPAQTHSTSAAERLQLATLFGMLGTLLGILGVALVLWLFNLQGQLQGQREDINEMDLAVRQMRDSQRLANDTLVSKIGGDNPESFVARYNKVATERDEAVRLLGVQKTMNEVLGAHAKSLETSLQSTQKDLEQAKAGAKEAPELRKQVADLEDKIDRKQRQLDAAAPLLDYKDGATAVSGLLNDLRKAQYYGYAGWGVSALLAAGLAAMFFLYKPTVPDGEATGPDVNDGDRPTHRII
jgi:proteasome lid subunit RPN8/RPN11